MGEAVARWDNGRNDEGLLLFKRGDLLKITAMEVRGFSLYYRAYCKGEEGLVSGSMIDIKPYRWYWAGNMTRSVAEKELLRNRDKKFLIREASTWCYYLSYQIQGKVYHFKIVTKDTQFERTFSLFTIGSSNKKAGEFNSIMELAWFVQKKAFYTCIWWKPCDDEIDHLEIRSKKYRKWSPNT